MKTKKVISLIMLVFIIAGQFCSFATSVGEVKNVHSIADCGKHLKYSTVEISTDYVVYEENGKQYPAYCVDASVEGADASGYGVTVAGFGELVYNQQIWRVLMNGFPYKTAAEMGLPDDYTAFATTKQAIYSILDGRDTSLYTGIDDIGNLMANKIRELVEIGKNGSQTYIDPVITADAVNQAGVDSVDDKYVSQTFTLNSTVNVKDINVILDTLSAPEGTKITDTNNQEKTTFNKGEQFKVIVPRVNIKSDIAVQISIDGQCESYPIFLGRAPSADVQNYVLTSDPFILSSSRAVMKYTPVGDIDVEKVSKEYNQYTNLEAGAKLKGAKFLIESEDKSFSQEAETDENGKIYLKDLKLGKYKITELKSADYYVLGEKYELEVEITHDGEVVVAPFENENVNLNIDVEKEGPTETEKGEVIDYKFNHVGNYSNTEVSNFIWGDKLPKEVRIQELETGIWNEDLKYKIQYITNKNTNWKDVKEGETYTTTENHKIDLTSGKLGLENDEYVTEVRLVFGDVKAGFEATTTPIVRAKVNDDVENNKIFTNDTYVTASYLQTELKEDDDAHTIVYTKTPQTPQETKKQGIEQKIVELPKTGF